MDSIYSHSCTLGSTLHMLTHMHAHGSINMRACTHIAHIHNTHVHTLQHITLTVAHDTHPPTHPHIEAHTLLTSTNESPTRHIKIFFPFLSIT